MPHNIKKVVVETAVRDRSLPPNEFKAGYSHNIKKRRGLMPLLLGFCLSGER